MNIRVSANCLCGRNEQEVELACDLPVPRIACHCNICRHTTGALFASCLPLATQPQSLVHLTQYPSSNGLSRYFCKHCGSHQYIQHTEPLQHENWDVCAGAVEKRLAGAKSLKDTGLVDFQQHEFVADTTDGGLAPALAQINGHAVSLFAEGPTGDSWTFVSGNLAVGPHSGEEVEAAISDQTPGRDRLKASCHCGGIQYCVTRPKVDSHAFSAPWPDLLVPYHSSSSANPDDVKWWLRGAKYLAGTCTCRSCRLGLGFPIQAWAFIPEVNLCQPDGSPIDFAAGTLLSFESSPGVFRYFCRTCGATAFWRSSARPDLVDVSVGLLRAPEGSLARTWLEWHTDRVSFREETLDEPLVEALEVGLKRPKG